MVCLVFNPNAANALTMPKPSLLTSDPLHLLDYFWLVRGVCALPEMPFGIES